MIGEAFRLVRRSLRQHAVSTLVTAFSVALAAGLLMGVFSLSRQVRHAFTGGDIGYDAVLGARGSQLQLVLNTVYHLETSPGNIPYALYKEIGSNPRYGVELAIPYALGDNYKGYRIVGTTPEVFTKYEYQRGKTFTFAPTQPAGKPFEAISREAVIGSLVAARTGLKIGDEFNAYHGVTYDESAIHPELFKVVGILEPTGTPSDRVIWIPLEGIFRMSGHVLRGTGEAFTAGAGESIPDAHKEVSAVMLKLSSPMAGMKLDQLINRQGKVATLAWPIGKSIAELFDKMGWAVRVLELVAYLVALVAAASILASVYNTMNERRREFAILRALGARRPFVFAVIVAEAGATAALGSVGGYLVYGVIMWGAAWVVQARTGVVLAAFSFDPSLVWVPIAMTVLGALAGLLPAAKAYSTEVAENLIPST